MRYRSAQLFAFCLVAGLSTRMLSVAAQEVAFSPPLPGLENISDYLPPVVDPMRLELDLNRRRVTVYQKNQAVKSYPVAIGRAGWETPAGSFAVKTMYRDPPWKHPFDGFVIPGGDPENPLGRRWIGFWTDGKHWIGFHGTPTRDSVGRAASHGCVRMYDEDIEELFELVAVGTPVKVTR